MPNFKLTFIFSAFNQGWSEVWYRNASSAIAAANYNNADLQNYLAYKGAGCVVQGLRVAEVNNPRSSRLSVIEQDVTALQTNPLSNMDSAGACILGYVNGNSGSRRPLMQRGVADILIQRDASARPILTGQIKARTLMFNAALVALGLQIRTLDDPISPGNPDIQISSLAPLTGDPSQTVITVIGLAPTGPGRVVFHGLNRNVFSGFGGSVPFINVFGTTNQIVVPVRWQQPATTVNGGRATLRFARYSYYGGLSAVVEDFRTRKVGRPSLAARGRRTPIKYRAF
jgi:hypothetical protein